VNREHLTPLALGTSTALGLVVALLSRGLLEEVALALVAAPLAVLVFRAVRPGSRRFTSRRDPS